MPEFNLIDEPWIPCIDLQGHNVEYGIRDTLLNAHELSEINDDSPLVTVSLLRLLIAILYRIYNGPETFNDWRELYNGKTIGFSDVISYLNKWRDRFDLLSVTYPFYQMSGLEMNQTVSVARLATECASGNNVTLFDHHEDDFDVDWAPAKTARYLVACQSFALGFGKSGNARIDGKEEMLPYSADGILLRGMNIWLQGVNLFETFLINLIPISDNSSPPWELDNPHIHRDFIKGPDKKVVTACSVVDRLTWQSRLIRLLPNEQCFSRMYFAQGRSADKSVGDPMKVYRASKKEGISVLPLNSEKSTWRDAHSMLMIPSANSNERRPECFNIAARASDSQQKQFLVNIVGLASAPNKAGKFLLWRHERMPVSNTILSNINMIERLGLLLSNAENVAKELNTRTRRIARLYLAPEAESPNGRKPDPEELNKVAESIDPRSAYWARLEEHFYVLLNILPNDWDGKKNEWKPDAQQEATIAWRAHIISEAKNALLESIQSLGTTARAIQAVARVHTYFSDKDLNPSPENAAKSKSKKRGGNKE